MPLHDPCAVYTASSNMEAHFLCGLLIDSGIDAAVIEDVSQVGVWAGGLIPEIHKPRVWVERTEIDRARTLLEDYERRSAERRNPETDGELIEVTCDECGRSSMFPAVQMGTVQNCRYCNATVDVGNDVDFEGWDEVVGEEESDA